MIRALPFIEVGASSVLLAAFVALLLIWAVGECARLLAREVLGNGP